MNYPVLFAQKVVNVLTVKYEISTPQRTKLATEHDLQPFVFTEQAHTLTILVKSILISPFQSSTLSPSFNFPTNIL